MVCERETEAERETDRQRERERNTDTYIDARVEEDEKTGDASHSM